MVEEETKDSHFSKRHIYLNTHYGIDEPQVT